ncbi:hypothetical protein [Pelagovum pacificum]|uniref:Sulfotransferase domain-containing protein n=1 Tax=Pelagovum pacificum TaxID=2588711 RepID=A0A5C5G7K3_9RHOB|nr:hypothetical protein [Pelagovum pacificum]QQA45095.1 hypothetical protein I8N54_19950 [Pelagovum pacificum]TNY30531.1 hypothetical protein FHY64_19595 [Pelagovum pacificum]
MAKRLVLHVGDFKSGSTSIQVCLHRRGVVPQDQSLIYPGRAIGHYRLARAIRSGDEAAIARLSRPLVEEIRASDADVAILSAEHFQDMAPAMTRAWVESWLPELAGDVRVICYVRPHAGFILATYAEQVKLGVRDDEVDAFLDFILPLPRVQFAHRFGSWQREFPDFILRPVVPGLLSGGDVVRDFFEQVLDGPFTLEGEVRANSSLSLGDLALMRRFHRWLPLAGPALREMLALRLQDRLAHRPEPGARRPVFTEAQLDRVRAACGRDAARLDGMFFEGTPMSDALANAKSVPEAPAVEGRVTGRQARALAMLGPALLREAVQRGFRL